MIQAYETLSSELPLLVEMLNEHANQAVSQNISNSNYAEAVRLKTERLPELINHKSGQVNGLIAAWAEDVQPIVETVFGVSLEGQPVGELVDYTPTIFEDICGRVRLISIDEIWGPALALDLIAKEDLERLQK